MAVTPGAVDTLTMDPGGGTSHGIGHSHGVCASNPVFKRRIAVMRDVRARGRINIFSIYTRSI
jgi:hypothetical protein